MRVDPKPMKTSGNVELDESHMLAEEMLNESILGMIKSVGKKVAGAAKKILGPVFKKFQSLLQQGTRKFLSALGLENMFDGLRVEAPAPELKGQVTWE